MKLTPKQRLTEMKTKRKTGDDLGAFLARRRNEGRTLEDIAKELDVSKGTIVIWLNKFGVRSVFSTEDAVPLKEAASATG